MMYLKLQQQGRKVNHKRVDRLYAEAQLQLRRPHPQEGAHGGASAAGAARRRERSLVHGFCL